MLKSWVTVICWCDQLGKIVQSPGQHCCVIHPVGSAVPVSWRVLVALHHIRILPAGPPALSKITPNSFVLLMMSCKWFFTNPMSPDSSLAMRPTMEEGLMSRWKPCGSDHCSHVCVPGRQTVGDPGGLWLGLVVFGPASLRYSYTVN